MAGSITTRSLRNDYLSVVTLKLDAVNLSTDDGVNVTQIWDTPRVVLPVATYYNVPSVNHTGDASYIRLEVLLVPDVPGNDRSWIGGGYYNASQGSVAIEEEGLSVLGSAFETTAATGPRAGLWHFVPKDEGAGGAATHEAFGSSMFNGVPVYGIRLWYDKTGATTAGVSDFAASITMIA